MQLKTDGCTWAAIYFHMFTMYVFNPIVSLDNKMIVGPENALRIREFFRIWGL